MGGIASLTINGTVATLITTMQDNQPTSNAIVMRKARDSSGSPAAVQSGDTIGGLNVRGYGATGYAATGKATFSFRAAENWTDTAQGTDFVLETTAIGGTTRTARMTVQLGLVMAGATGGDKGAGTVNATAVYDDNTLLTCMAMAKEFADEGRVDLTKWDALVPDQIVPEAVIVEPVMWPVLVAERRAVDAMDEQGRLVRRFEVIEREVRVPAVIADPVYDEAGKIIDAIETPLMDEVTIPEQVIVRQHRTARVFQAMLDSGFDPRDPEQYFTKMRTDEALPGMPTQADWEHNGLSIGELHGREWLAMEMLAIVCNVMWGKLKDHEARLTAGGL